LNVVLAALRAPGGAELAFARALRDPRVRRAATAADVDLSDRRALAALLARAKHALDRSPEPAFADRATPLLPRDEELAAVENHHARHAIRTYLAVSRLA